MGWTRSGAAAFTTQTKAEEFIIKMCESCAYASTNPDDYWVDAHELDTADPKIGRTPP